MILINWVYDICYYICSKQTVKRRKYCSLRLWYFFNTQFRDEIVHDLGFNLQTRFTKRRQLILPYKTAVYRYMDYNLQLLASQEILQIQLKSLDRRSYHKCLGRRHINDLRMWQQLCNNEHISWSMECESLQRRIPVHYRSIDFNPHYSVLQFHNYFDKPMFSCSWLVRENVSEVNSKAYFII